MLVLLTPSLKPWPFLRQNLFSLYFFVSCVVRLYYFVHQLPPWCIFTGKCIRLVSVFICFSVFGTHDEAQSLSFLDVFSNKTIQNYAMTWFLRYSIIYMCFVDQYNISLKFKRMPANSPQVFLGVSKFFIKSPGKHLPWPFSKCFH